MGHSAHHKPETDLLGPDASDRIRDILETVQAFASLDFTRHAAVGEKGSELDALAAGINMLGEEVQASREELEARVAERTKLLKDLTESMEYEVEERRRIEVDVRETNKQLSRSVKHLEQVNREVEKLTELSNLLQVCGDRDEAFSVLGHVGPELFAGTEGTVFVFRSSRDAITCAASWGNGNTSGEQFDPGDCWALRRGSVHHGHAGSGLRCKHVPADWHGETLCVPLVAQGETSGLLHLRWVADDEWQDGSRDAGGSHGPGASYRKLALATAEQIALALANLELRAALDAQSIRDPLTSLFNRRYMDETLEREIRRAERAGASVAFLMLDVDHFKQYNDTYGHDAGDAALRMLAQLIREDFRGEDVVCRYGGEELAVIMAGAGREDAVRRAEELRKKIAGARFDWEGQPTGPTTISIGVATFPENAETREGLIRVADRALYRAKEHGRNRVEISSAGAAGKDKAPSSKLDP